VSRKRSKPAIRTRNPNSHAMQTMTPPGTCIILFFQTDFIGLSQKLKLRTQSYRHKFRKLRCREKGAKIKPHVTHSQSRIPGRQCRTSRVGISAAHHRGELCNWTAR